MKSYGVLFSVSAVLMAMLAPAVSAGGCHVPFRSAYIAPVYHAPYVAPIVKEVIVEKVVNFARIVEIPIYSTYIAAPVASYYANPLAPVGGPPAQVKSECADAIAGFKAMQAELAALKLQLKQPQREQQPYHPPTMPPATEPRPEPPIDPFSPASKAPTGGVRERILARTTKYCVSCHSDTTKDKGEGLVLVKGGQLVDVSPMLGDIIKYVSTKGCPKKSATPMPPEERLEYIADLTLASSGGK